MIANVGKDQLIKTLRERLQWLVHEADEKEYDENEVEAIVDTLSVLDPIEIPGDYFTPEEAFKRFWKNQERMREMEARRNGEFYISRLEESGFWDQLDAEFPEPEELSDDADAILKEEKEGVIAAGLGSPDAETAETIQEKNEEAAAEEISSISDDEPVRKLQEIKSEYLREKLNKSNNSQLLTATDAAQGSPAPTGAVTRDAEENTQGERIVVAISQLSALEKSGIDVEAIRKLLENELEEVKREREKMNKRKREQKWNKAVSRGAVAAALVFAIGVGGTVGVYAEKGGFFHWQQNDDEKVQALVSAVDDGTKVVEALSYDKIEDVSVKYLGYLWVPEDIPIEYELDKVVINNDSIKVRTELRYVSSDEKFLVFARRYYGKVIAYTDQKFDLFETVDTKIYGEDVEVKYLKKENSDYTEYIVQFSIQSSIYYINSNLPLEELEDIADNNIKALL